MGRQRESSLLAMLLRLCETLCTHVAAPVTGHFRQKLGVTSMPRPGQEPSLWPPCSIHMLSPGGRSPHRRGVWQPVEHLLLPLWIQTDPTAGAASPSQLHPTGSRDPRAGKGLKPRLSASISPHRAKPGKIVSGGEAHFWKCKSTGRARQKAAAWSQPLPSASRELWRPHLFSNIC